MAWSVLAGRGHPLRAGLLFATGAITGIHDVAPGQIGRVEVDGGPTIEVRTVDLGAGQVGEDDSSVRGDV